MSYSETVAPLSVHRRVGFVMLSTLAQDERRMRPHHGAIPRKEAFMKSLQSKDLAFTQVPDEVGMYFIDRKLNAQHRGVADRCLSQLDYLLVFGVTYEPIANASNIMQDTLRPRLYNSHGQLVKRLQECYWTDSAVELELATLIDSLARAIRMELRSVIRRMEELP